MRETINLQSLELSKPPLVRNVEVPVEVPVPVPGPTTVVRAPTVVRTTRLGNPVLGSTYLGNTWGSRTFENGTWGNGAWGNTWGW